MLSRFIHTAEAMIDVVAIRFILNRFAPPDPSRIASWVVALNERRRSCVAYGRVLASKGRDGARQSSILMASNSVVCMPTDALPSSCWS